jgi:hypothetical protein
MRQATSRSPVRRIVAGLLLAVFCAPAPVWAADESTAESGEESAEESPAEPPAPIETHWYDSAVRNFDITVDLILIRPLAAITAVAGAALFVPAVIMTAPNGKDSIKDAYDRFVREPGEYFASRPLGEF